MVSSYENSHYQQFQVIERSYNRLLVLVEVARFAQRTVHLALLNCRRLNIENGFIGELHANVAITDGRIQNRDSGRSLTAEATREFLNTTTVQQNRGSVRHTDTDASWWTAVAEQETVFQGHRTAADPEGGANIAAIEC